MSKGKIEVIIPKFNFSPGETVNGEVILKLDAPLKARGLKIAILGKRISKPMSINPGKMSSRTTSSTIFDFTEQLDGEKEYNSSELRYPFSIKIPEGIYSVPEPSGVVGTMLAMGKALSQYNSRVEWNLIANLDVPWGFDISTKIQISVDEKK